MRLELHPEARAELRSAALWYDERRPRSNWRRSRILPGMAGHSGSRPADPQDDHPTVPYVIAFEKHEHHVLVLAVAHAKRRPLYWLTRTTP